MKKHLDIDVDVNIYLYDSYREYLKDYFDEYKKIEKRFSLAAFAKNADISTNLIGLIIRGERNISHKMANKICDSLTLQSRKKRFFLLLVEYNQARDIDLADETYREIVKIQKAVGVYELSESQHEYYNKWYYHVIKELLTWFDWENDYKKLAKAVIPQITESEARKAVEVLTEIGLIKKVKGKYIDTNFRISGENVPIHKKEILRKEIMSFGSEATTLFNTEERHTSFHTLSLSKEKYERVVEIIKEAENKIEEIIDINEEQNERVYEIVFNAFPISRKLNVEN